MYFLEAHHSFLALHHHCPFPPEVNGHSTTNREQIPILINNFPFLDGKSAFPPKEYCSE